MRFHVQVTRIQTAKRTIAAIDEEDALLKARTELEQPYGFLGRWETMATDAEVIEGPTPGQVEGAPAEAPLLLSVADAAEHLGIARASLYELIKAGGIEHVQVGRRRLISRQALVRFIEAHTRPL